MKKLLLLTAFVIATVALPLQFSYGFEAFSKANFGAYSVHGQTSEFALSVGANAVLATDKETNSRIMQYVGIFRANMTEEIKGITTFTQIEKYLQIGKVQPYITFGGGTLWQIKDEEDLLHADLKFEFGAHLANFVSIGLGFDYVPVKGPDATFFYLSVNLISPL